MCDTIDTTHVIHHDCSPNTCPVCGCLAVGLACYSTECPSQDSSPAAPAGGLDRTPSPDQHGRLR